MRDREAMFSYKQPVAATDPSEDVVFTGKGDAGSGQPITLEVVTPAVTGGGTVTVTLQHSDSDTGTFVDKASWTVDAEALAKGGSVLTAALPNGLKDYLRLTYTLNGSVGGFTPTANLQYSGQTNGTR